MALIENNLISPFYFCRDVTFETFNDVMNEIESVVHDGSVVRTMTLSCREPSSLQCILLRSMLEAKVPVNCTSCPSKEVITGMELVLKDKLSTLSYCQHDNYRVLVPYRMRVELSYPQLEAIMLALTSFNK